jgi:hypothetical protein
MGESRVEAAKPWFAGGVAACRPRGHTGESMIATDDRQERLGQLFSSVQKVARVDNPHSMPYEHFDVLYRRGLK